MSAIATAETFESRIARLDGTLFNYVLSQSTENDRRSLLAVQLALRERGDYVYLEIGSYRGGSLQPFLADPRCRKIISIDPRPPILPDERGENLSYYDNTTAAMLNELKAVPSAELGKIQSIEASTETILPKSLSVKPDVCFIDGEHTDAAVLRDSLFCFEALNGNGCITYHDANIVYNGIYLFIQELQRRGMRFQAANLSDSVFLIEVGATSISESAHIKSMQRESYKGYLWSLRENDLYRSFYNRSGFKLYRRLKAKTWNRVAGRMKRLFS
jgi:hypothetical protein